MKRLIGVIKITIVGFLVVNLFIGLILFLESYIEGTEMPLKYFGFVNLYGIITCVIFGYLDQPILEKRLLIGITIGTVLLIITSFFIGSDLLLEQSFFLFFGIVLGRKAVVAIDMFLNESD
ncbi:MAG: hypothetical protein FJZ67_05005 [Bacteroidetes bacterium]|nr:hypothetical protein [Bacteroidota bacterium]